MDVDVNLSQCKEMKQGFWKEFQACHHNGLYTDLEIVGAAQQKILCHKLTLASMSQTLKALLTSVGEDEVTKVVIPELDVMELDFYLRDLYSCLAGGKEYDTINVSNNLISLLHLKTLSKDSDFKENSSVWNGEDVKIKLEEEVQVHDFYTDIDMNPSFSIQGGKRKMDWELEEMFDHDIDQFDLEEVEEKEQEVAIRPRKKRVKHDIVDNSNVTEGESKTRKGKRKSTKASDKKDRMKIARNDTSVINTEIKIDSKDKTDKYLTEVSDIHERRKIHTLLKESIGTIDVCVSSEKLDYKKTFRYCNIGFSSSKPYFMAIFGIAKCNETSKVRGKPLVWSFPYARDLEEQFDNVFKAFQSVYGFSNADICYHSLIYARQGKYRKNKDSKVRHAMRRRYAGLENEKLQELLVKPDVIKAVKRYPKKADMSPVTGKLALQLDSTLLADNMEGILLVTWKDEDEAEARLLHVNEDEMDNASKYLMTMVFEVWTLERKVGKFRKVIPESQYLSQRFDELIIPMETLTVAKEFLQDTDRNIRDKILNRSDKTCPHCGTVFSIVTVSQQVNFTHHVKSHFYDKFQCDCNYQYSSMKEKMDHIKLVHESEAYEKCKLCDHVCNKLYMDSHVCKDIKNSGDYKGKLIVSITDGMLKLSSSPKKKDESSKEMKEKSAKMQALKNQNKMEKFDFICCNERFDTFFTISSHVRGHHMEDKDVQCGQCNYFGTYKSVHRHYLYTHMSTNNDKLSFVCEVCGKAKKNESSLISHMHAHHKKRKCELCGMEFSRYTSWKYHLKKVHDIGKPAVSPCEICGKEFQNKSRLKHHFMRMHMEDKERPHQCDQCGRGFAVKDNLTTHQMLAHIKSRPFKCRYGCGADYNDNSSRGTHELKKHGKKFPNENKVKFAQSEAIF